MKIKIPDALRRRRQQENQLTQHREASLLEALMTEGELPLTTTSLFLGKDKFGTTKQSLFDIAYPSSS